jgi:geranylgeranyl diphosphate synthase type II
MRGLAYQAADDLKDVISPEEDSGKSSGRDEALGRPNLVVAEGLSAALRRFRRLTDTADRVQATLPGAAERWRMLDMLRVPLPLSAAECGSSQFSAAI